MRKSSWLLDHLDQAILNGSVLYNPIS